MLAHVALDEGYARRGPIGDDIAGGAGAAASITPNASIVLCALSMCFPRMTMFTLRVGAARQATLSDTRKYYLAHR